MQLNEDSPEAFKQHLQTLFADDSLVINDFLSWAEKAQSNARRASDNEAVDWYKNAMLIYDFLQSKEERPFSTNHIYMRLNIIRIYEYNDPKSIPYQEEIITWILKAISQATVEQIKAESSSWQSLSMERIRELRMVKNRLRFAQELSEHNVLLNDVILEFIPIMTQLP